MEAFTTGENPVLHVVTVQVAGERDGCLVGFATQCSIIPERFLVCLSVLNRTYELARRADVLAVHRLRTDQLELARRFGAARGDEVDKFAGLAWRPGVSGAPVLEGCAAYLEGSIQSRHPLGDHCGFVLAPLAAAGGGGGGEALRMDAVDFGAGHPPGELRRA
ncbi:MAG TPA: flavin reductase family protein [Acidimicrobiales bacterium]|nr:flavin reductase family protein [Acidimicrobiales bacterium]